MPSKVIVSGESGYDTRQIVIVNPSDRGYTRHRYVLWAGPLYLMIWADDLESASEIMCDHLVEHAPGLLCDEQVEELYREKMAEIEAEEGPLPALAPARAREEEKRQERAREYAESDTTCFGHDGIHYIASDEWGISLEDPEREELLALMDPDHPKLEKDPLIRVAKKAQTLSRIAA